MPGGRGLRAGVLNRGTGILCRLWVRGTGEPDVIESLLCLTLCSPMDCCMPGFPVRSLLKLMSIESVMPSNHLILCGPLLLLPSILPSIRVFSCVSAQVIGEGNGNPLQCSCLENPRDGGAWRAAIYGVTQSRTRPKRLSSSSSSCSGRAVPGLETCDSARSSCCLGPLLCCAAWILSSASLQRQEEWNENLVSPLAEDRRPPATPAGPAFRSVVSVPVRDV